jgi:flagellar hook-basal body complex protein FliE
VTQDKQKDPKIRKNVSLRKSVIKIGEALVEPLHKNSFSQLLEDLVRDADKRQTSGGEKSQEQYLTEIVDLLAKVRVLEAKLKEKDERFKLERK